MALAQKLGTHLLNPRKEVEMNSLVEKLSQYASYHRDPRNIVTHFIGIPMIVLAVIVLLSRPYVEFEGLTLSPTLLVVFGSCIYYLKLDIRYGLTMAVLYGFGVWIGNHIALQDQSVWLSFGIGLFVVGWIFQFVGHFWEGKKPAFVDDLVGLIIGPLFVVAEAGFMLGLRKDVESAIQTKAGTIRRRVL